MKLDAHGMAIDLPHGWSGRIFARAADLTTVHAGDFQLPLQDGEFGDRATGLLPAGGAFIAVTEYRPGAGLQPGEGLFAALRLPLPLEPRSFASTRLAHPRPGQLGAQHFVTLSRRPFCLYVVISGPRSRRRQQLLRLDRVLRSLRVAGPPPTS